MSPEQILRVYFRAKDENRPFLLAGVFSENATLEISNRSDQISFPPVTSGLAQIGDVLVRRFNQAYENIYSFYIDCPASSADTFTCDWLVGMTEKETKNVRVGQEETFPSGSQYGVIGGWHFRRSRTARHEVKL